MALQQVLVGLNSIWSINIPLYVNDMGFKSSMRLLMLGIILKHREISTKRWRLVLRGKEGVEQSREREREREMITKIYYVKEYTRIARRLKTSVEPIWFEVMPCASFYSVFKNTPEFLECSREIWNIHQFSIVKLIWK